MGIQDRDYYRDGPGFLDRVGQQGATVWLIAITCGVFLGQMFSGVTRSPLVQIGVYDPRLIMEGEVWRLLTSCFLHASIGHIFWNMLILYWAGQAVEDLYGSFEFVLFYLASGIIANLGFLVVQLAGFSDMGRALGASGAVMAVLIVFACHYPHLRVRLWFLIPMPVWLLAVFALAGDIIFAMGAVAGNGRWSQTAHFVHLGGAVFGLLYYQSGWRFSTLFARSPRTRARPKLRVVSVPEEERTPQPVGAPVEVAARPAANPAGGPADEQLEAKLDAVLEKVSRHGQESLTAEEREILAKASELYKKRRK
jgi:membrane associated rhomboid family serine protease